MPTATSQDRLRDATQALIQTVTSRTIGAADKKVTGLTSRMESMAQNGGLNLSGGVLKGAIGGGASAMMSNVGKAVKEKGSSVAHGITDKLPGGSSSDSAESSDEGGGGSAGGGSSTKVTTIIEEIDVGVPIALAYDQWTEFGSFPSFMKKVENVNAVEDQRLKWKAQILWSHREWESTILEQKPEDRIVWKSEGKKGYVDGAVTFHELADNLTRIIVVLEYHPQGLFERTGNIWRAQARRVRAELQHFRRHVMAHAVLDPDSVQGWRGTIEDAEVVESDEEAQQGDQDQDQGDQDQGDQDQADQDQADQADQGDQDQDSGEPEDTGEPEDSADDEPEDSADDEPEDSADDEPEDSADDEPEDSAEDEEPDEDEQDEDEQSADRDEYADDDTTDEVDDEYADDEEDKR